MKKIRDNYFGASSIFSPFWLKSRCMSGSVFRYMFNSINKHSMLNFQTTFNPQNSTCIERVVIRKCIDLGDDEFHEQFREGIALKLVGILDRGLEQRRRVLFPAVHWPRDTNVVYLEWWDRMASHDVRPQRKINSKPSSSCRLETSVGLFQRISRSTIPELQLTSYRRYFSKILRKLLSRDLK